MKGLTPWRIAVPAWRALADARAQERLGEVLRSWEGTRYLAGQQARGAAADCAGFVVGVLNELAGTAHVAARIAPDAGAHAPDRAGLALEGLVATFGLEPVAVVEGVLVLEPGDVIVTGPVARGPTHGLLVGDERRMVWDATGRGVRRISLGLLALVGHEVFGAWRLRDRSWK